MPTRPQQPCPAPGCPELVTYGRCPTHTPPRAPRKPENPLRATAHQRGYDHKWRKFRAWYLTLNPHCQHTGCDQPATEVDHMDGLGPLGERGYDPTNCRGLCKPHHSQRTARDQPGGWNKRKPHAT